MDLSCIIESGDLELYVLGMLPKADAIKIEQLAALFPEVRTELDRISESLEGLSATAGATPAPSVKSNLMQKFRSLKEEEQAGASAPVQQLNNNRDEDVSPPPVVPMYAKTRARVLSVAAVLAMVVSLGLLIYVSRMNQKKNEALAALNQRVQTMQKAAADQQAQMRAYNKTLQMQYDEAYKKIELTSVPGKPKALAQVFWNTKTHEVYLADVSLPQTPGNRQYQLWAIVNGKPVSAGLLSGPKMQMQKMSTFDKADAFAITLEKKGGSEVPTMEALYVMAKVS